MLGSWYLVSGELFCASDHIHIVGNKQQRAFVRLGNPEHDDHGEVQPQRGAYRLSTRAHVVVEIFASRHLDGRRPEKYRFSCHGSRNLRTNFECLTCASIKVRNPMELRHTQEYHPLLPWRHLQDTQPPEDDITLNVALILRVFQYFAIELVVNA